MNEGWSTAVDEFNVWQVDNFASTPNVHQTSGVHAPIPLGHKSEISKFSDGSLNDGEASPYTMLKQALWSGDAERATRQSVEEQAKTSIVLN